MMQQQKAGGVDRLVGQRKTNIYVTGLQLTTTSSYSSYII